MEENPKKEEDALCRNVGTIDHCDGSTIFKESLKRSPPSQGVGRAGKQPFEKRTAVEV